MPQTLRLDALVGTGVAITIVMTPEPTTKSTEMTEDLSRFESEGGPTDRSVEHREERPLGLQPRDADHRGRVLIVYANQEHATRAIAEALAVRLRSHGFTVEIGDPCTGAMPPPEDYDGVVLGVPMTSGRASTLIARYVDDNRIGLSDGPSALFAVGKARTLHDRDGFVEQFLRSASWHPDLATTFSEGELRTSWTEVTYFADAIAANLANAAVTAERSEPHVFDAHP